MKILASNNRFLINGVEYLTGEPVQGFWIKLAEDQYIPIIQLNNQWYIYYMIEAEVEPILESKFIQKDLFLDNLIFKIGDQKFSPGESINGVFINQPAYVLINIDDTYHVFYTNYDVVEVEFLDIVQRILENKPMLDILFETLSDKDLISLASTSKDFGSIIWKRLAHRKYPQLVVLEKRLNISPLWYKILHQSDQEGINKATEQGFLDLLNLLYNQNNLTPSILSINKAAENGYLDVLKWIYEKTKELPDIYTTDRVNLDIMKWVYEINKRLPRQHAINLKAAQGDLAILKWVYKQNKMLPNVAGLNDAAKENQLPVLKWAYKKDNRLPSIDGLNQAAQKGHLDLLKWVYDTSKILPNKEGIFGAIMEGQLNILKWVYGLNKLILTKKMISWAATFNSINILEWIYELTKVLPDQTDINKAADGGDLNLLEWTYSKNKKLPDKSGINLAALNGHLNVLKWIYDKNGMLPDKFIINIMKQNSQKSNLEMIQWFQHLK